MTPEQQVIIDRVDITEHDIKNAQKFPSDFGLSSSADHYEEIYETKTWSLGQIIRNRDSSLREQSNADTLEKMLNEEYPELSEDWIITSCNHFACGWVDHLSFKIFEEDGKTPSNIFKVLKDFFDGLSSYGIADESDLSRREYEDCLENIGNVYLRHREMIDNLPEDWKGQCYEWFSNNNERAIEPSDGNGGYPDDKEMIPCLEALGFLKPEGEEE